MISIKEMSSHELWEHIEAHRETLDRCGATEGDIGNALAEIAVAERELRKRMAVEIEVDTDEDMEMDMER